MMLGFKFAIIYTYKIGGILDFTIFLVESIETKDINRNTDGCDYGNVHGEFSDPYLDAIAEALENVKTNDLEKAKNDLNEILFEHTGEKFMLFGQKSRLNSLANATFKKADQAIKSIKEFSENADNYAYEKQLEGILDCLMEIFRISKGVEGRLSRYLKEYKTIDKSLTLIELKAHRIARKLEIYSKGDRVQINEIVALKEIAENIIDDSMNAKEFIKAEYPLINLWSQTIDVLSIELRSPELIISGIKDGFSLMLPIILMDLGNLKEYCNGYQSHALNKLFLE